MQKRPRRCKPQGKFLGNRFYPPHDLAKGCFSSRARGRHGAVPGPHPAAGGDTAGGAGRPEGRWKAGRGAGPPGAARPLELPAPRVSPGGARSESQSAGAAASRWAVARASAPIRRGAGQLREAGGARPRWRR